ncbi:hypothetical protein [Aquimarina pacifica]|uniref:hypothetical protein n=1 Tax=Aquimarina pacifica TaxID=1296415 RepID=UPI00046ECA1F|nr:hypothetical protein [Aquimarina pacifica]
MVVLKKIRGATLVEVLTASVLIIIVFMIASLSFNNVFGNQIQRGQSAIENRIKELQYLYRHEVLKLPYAEDFDGWEIIVTIQGAYAVFSYSKEEVEIEKKELVQE